jgi:hypothetical protein
MFVIMGGSGEMPGPEQDRIRAREGTQMNEDFRIST